MTRTDLLARGGPEQKWCVSTLEGWWERAFMAALAGSSARTSIYDTALVHAAARIADESVRVRFGIEVTE